VCVAVKEGRQEEEMTHHDVSPIISENGHKFCTYHATNWLCEGEGETSKWGKRDEEDA
jgi:hypothetical protein